MAAQKASVGLAKAPGKKIGGNFPPISEKPIPTLDSAGIDKDLAKTARKLAAVQMPQLKHLPTFPHARPEFTPQTRFRDGVAGNLLN